MALRQAKIVTITSVKGGTGKTTLALSLAGELSLHKKTVLLLDLDLYESALAMQTASDPDRNLFTLIDDLKNNRYTSDIDYVSKYDDFLFVLPSPKDPRLASKITSKYIQIVLSKLKTRYDFIIMDTNHTMDSINLMAMDNSDEIFYCIEKDPIQIKNMKTIISIFGDIEKENYHIVLNEATRKMKGPISNYDANHMLEKEIEYTIPSSFTIKNIDDYTMEGKIMILDKKIRMHYKKEINCIDKMVNFLLTEKE